MWSRTKLTSSTAALEGRKRKRRGGVGAELGEQQAEREEEQAMAAA